MKENKELNIVLAGNANVGKSVIFNHLTGLHQHIGNWPGKTIEKAEGTLHYRGYTINVLDLPGIYSLSTYSTEEIIARDYIASQKPDFIINVVDATHLERNLIFTWQLLELKKPMVLALNMVNLLKEKGIEIDIKKLEKALKIPVVPTAAIYGKGITEILNQGIRSIKRKRATTDPIKYGKEMEEKIGWLTERMAEISSVYPKRWLAIKLLEKDKIIEKLFEKKNSEILEQAKIFRSELKKVHGHDPSIMIADERCHLVSQVVKEAVRVTEPQATGLNERLDNITCHKILGFPTMIFILGLVFLSVFQFGNRLSYLLEKLSFGWEKWYEGMFGVSLWTYLGWSVAESAFALIQIALPYIFPFYFLLFFLEDWGYLARVAFLMDNFMHKVGVHGKACIPLMLGFGCNVPACLACRIMETRRERFITGVLTTFIPCSAVSVIIIGLVGKFIGLSWALGLYGIAFLTIFVLGKLVSKILPGEATELIMEMPDYKIPHFRTVILQTWFRLKEFIVIAGPVVIISGIVIRMIRFTDWLTAVADWLSPITVNWLGLPAITGVLLIFGILRKELILVMLAALLGTADFSQILSPRQMVTLALVSMFYFPCLATFAAFRKEFGLKEAIGVASFKIIFAIIYGGLFYRLGLLF
ncbi:MAG: ferrous iron transport protein B [Candidatus Pacebacteria bacterium]|nr:ferrous iron transport protein B [Candidatus Paceibacterota bacterium]